MQMYKSWNHTDTASFRKEIQKLTQMTELFQMVQDNYRGTGEGIGGVGYQSMYNHH